MKRTNTIFLLIIISFIIGSVSNVNGQGRGRSRDGDGNRDRNDHYHDRDREDRSRQDRHDNGRRNYHDKHHHHNDRREVRHVYHYDRHHHHRPVVVHHYSRPRYVYYRDYDVYYDCHKNVYISYSGRGWTMSTAVPVVMHRVDMRHTRRFEVDYYEDDFPRYLETRRPSYGRQCDDW